VTIVATNSAPCRSEVETWLASVRSEQERLQAQVEPLLAEQGRLRERETLLVKLLQSFDAAPATPTGFAGTETPDAMSLPAVEGSVLDYVRTNVIGILQGAEGPMHINDIHRRFVAQGLRVPGAGRPANLTAHLSRCEGIVSPSRGFYALGTDNPTERAPRKRRRRTRR
jgi:hypothetical protein